MAALQFCVLWLVQVTVDSTPTHIATPSPAQLRYQSTDFVGLIHLNMGTFAHNGDPSCDKTNWNVKADYASGKTNDPATFHPKKLNTSQWFESLAALGANIAVLTAKHGCGFTLWPTNATLPNGSPYGYSVGSPGAAIQKDVLQQFVDSAKAAGFGYGFYYSIMKNFFLCRSFDGSNSCMEEVLPGQLNLTSEQYKKIAREQVIELWTRYGNLTEIWVDSGTDGLEGLMAELQPYAVEFGAPHNPVGWCGTESGHPSRKVGPGPIWNPYLDIPTSQKDKRFGTPNGTIWYPKLCDPTSFQDHIWFWEPNHKVRTLEMMIPIYHDIVGRGMVMELGVHINRDGLVPDTHAKMYRELGDWIQQCYGSPLSMAYGRGELFVLHVQAGAVFDRFQLQENIAVGQRVLNYTIESSPDGSSWVTHVSDSAIGMKRIHLLPNPITATSNLQIRLLITNAMATPEMKFFGVFKPCANDTSSSSSSPAVWI